MNGETAAKTVTAAPEKEKKINKRERDTNNYLCRNEVTSISPPEHPEHLEKRKKELK